MMKVKHYTIVCAVQCLWLWPAVFSTAQAQEDGSGVVNERKEPGTDLPGFTADTRQLFNEFLLGVSDTVVNTTRGHLPRLPRYLKGNYREGITGPPVRVLWPAPKDNSAATQNGRYQVTGRVPGTEFRPKAIVLVQTSETEPVPERNLEMFGLDRVALKAETGGRDMRFARNRDKFIHTLAGTNPDDFLYMFRDAFGQEQPGGAEPLGVWDSQETKLRGHATGHYLTAIAQAYAGTGDTSLRSVFARKMDYMVRSLYELSKRSGKPLKSGGEHVADPAKVPPGPGKSMYDSDLSKDAIRNDFWNWGAGYISAYPPDQFIMLEQGAVYGREDTDVWAPYYTLHKLLAGLLDVYELSGNQKALAIAEGMGTWVDVRLSRLPEEALLRMWSTYIAGEFGGMNEVMARLYRLTREPRFLETARLFDNIKVFYGNTDHDHGLAKNVDTFRGLHANQHIPQMLGALELFRGSGVTGYYRIADNFWYRATNDYSYSIGGVAGARNPANPECFVSEPGALYANGFSAGGQNETCATYNMLKLTRNLFLYDQRPELMDYYERGLYNHILASVDADSPANTYHVPLRPGSIKSFTNPDMTGFTCCNGTALESHTKLQNSIYSRSTDNKALYVNLFIPSTLNWSERSIMVDQDTGFPKEDHTRLTIRGNGQFDLKLRVPGWATNGFFVSINGESQGVDAKPGSYLNLERTWEDGDTIDVRMPFAFRLVSVPDQQNIASLFYGPVLLAARENGPLEEWRKITLDARDIGNAITGNPQTLEFEIDGVAFRPFYNTYGYHSVYLDVELR